jgi:hypothetical protein
MVQLTLTQLTKIFSLKRSVFYRKLTKPVSDEQLKDKIEAVMADNPAYGHKRIARWSSSPARPAAAVAGEKRG